MLDLIDVGMFVIICFNSRSGLMAEKYGIFCLIQRIRRSSHSNAIAEQFPVVLVVQATTQAHLVMWIAHLMGSMLLFLAGVTSTWLGSLGRWDQQTF